MLYKRFYVLDTVSHLEAYGSRHPTISDLKFDHFVMVVNTGTLNGRFMSLLLQFRVILWNFVTILFLIKLTFYWFWVFPGGWAVKNPPANAGDMGSVPGSSRSPGGGNANLLQYSCLGNPMDTEEPGRPQSIESQTVGHHWDHWAYTQWKYRFSLKFEFQINIEYIFCMVCPKYCMGHMYTKFLLLLSEI